MITSSDLVDEELTVYAIWAKDFILTVNIAPATFNGVTNPIVLTGSVQTNIYDELQLIYPTLDIGGNAPALVMYSYDALRTQEVGFFDTITVGETKEVYINLDQMITLNFNFDGGNYISDPLITNYTGFVPINRTFGDYFMSNPLSSLIEKNGFTFDGWYYDISLTLPLTNTDEILVGLNNSTIYAKWVASFTVTFDSVGGSSVSSQEVISGELATEPTPPTRVGFNFTGWTLGVTPYIFTTPVTADITLVATWEAQVGGGGGTTQYTVTFDSVGGSAVTSQTVNENATATAPTEPTKANNEFVRWHSASTLNAPFNFSTPITANITLYAEWLSYTESTFTQLSASHGYTGYIDRTNVAILVGGTKVYDRGTTISDLWDVASGTQDAFYLLIASDPNASTGISWNFLLNGAIDIINIPNLTITITVRKYGGT